MRRADRLDRDAALDAPRGTAPRRTRCRCDGRGRAPSGGSGTPPSVASIAMAGGRTLRGAVELSPVVELTTVGLPLTLQGLSITARSRPDSRSIRARPRWTTAAGGRYCRSPLGGRALWFTARRPSRRGERMSLVDRAKGKAEQSKPRVSECRDLRPATSPDRDEKPPAGDDFYFKAVFDPTDPHLAHSSPPSASSSPRRSSPWAESSSSASTYRPTRPSPRCGS